MKNQSHFLHFFIMIATGLKNTPAFLAGVGIMLFFSSSVQAYVIFTDDFERTTLGSDWTLTDEQAEISTLTASSGTRSLDLYRSNPIVTSKTFDLAAVYPNVTLSAWIRRGSDAFSEDPDNGEDLRLEYLNDSGAWTTIATYAGGGTDGQIYNLSYSFASDAFHPSFQMRIREYNADGNGYDHWHIDDILLQSNMPADTLSANDAIVDEGTSATYYFYINASASGTVSWNTVDNGTANAGSDFNASAGVISYAAGENAYSITIPILEDSEIEGAETFSIHFAQTSGSLTLPTTDPVVTIEDNDGASGNYGNRDFVVVNPTVTRNLIGNVKTIGNTNLCITTGTSSMGSCISGTNTNTDNERYVQYINVENNDSDPTISVINDSSITSAFNASAATLDIHPTDLIPGGNSPEIVWAGLFWQGSIHRWNWGSENSWLNGQQISNIDLSNPDQFGQDEVLLHTPQMAANEYIKVISNGFYDYYNVYEEDYSGNTNDGGVYSVYSDVTEILRTYGDLADPNGSYRVANLQTMNGRESNLGNYGGWSLVVIYDNSDDRDELLRNVTVHSGYKVISAQDSTDETITIKDFSTPKDTSKPIDSTVSIFLGEAEKYTGDYAKIYAPDFESASAAHPLYDGYGTATNLFRGVISGVPGRIENYVNTDGIDIRNFNTGTTGMNVMYHDQHEAKILIGTEGDTYFPSMISFATELYRPDICYDYSIAQNDFTYNVEVPSNNIPRFAEYVDTNTPLEISMYFKNRTADIQADSLYYNPRDFNTTQVRLTNNSQTSPTYSPVDGLEYYDYNVARDNVVPDPNTFTGTETEFQIAIGRYADNLTFDTLDGSYVSGGGELGYNEGVFVQYHLMPQGHNMDFLLKGRLYYNFVANGKAAFSTPVELRIGVDLPRCEGAPVYQPTWGQFTVIDRNYKLNSTYDNTTQNAPYAHNLRTQIAGRPFQIDIVSLEEDTGTPGGWTNLDTNTSVVLTVHDAKSFEMNTTVSCVKPTSFDGSETMIFFDNSSRKHINTYFTIDRAMENAAVSILFLEDNASNLIEDWTCASTMDSSCWDNVYLTKISAFDTECAAECTASTGTECPSCLLRRSMKTLCSRDNFSVRPEAIDIYAVSDIDNTTDDESIHLAQKLNIPATTPALSAEYDYLYEANATSYTSRQAIAGYKPTFDQGLVYSKFKWNGGYPSACPDPTDINATVYFRTTGYAPNALDIQNVGIYELEIADQTWTNVDKAAYASWHFESDGVTPVPGFSSGDDCIIGSTTIPTVANVTGFSGCDINSTFTKNADSWFDNTGNLVSVNAYNYINKSVDVRPYDFNMTSPLQFGTRRSDVNGTAGFVYMNALDDNDTLYMSLHNKNNIVRAVGYKTANGIIDNNLTNFTANCFSRETEFHTLFTPIHLDGIDPFIYVMHEHNTTDTNNTINSDWVWRDTSRAIGSITAAPSLPLMSGGDVNISLPADAWIQSMSGRVNVDIYMDFNRTITTPQDPNIIRLNGFKVSCATPSECISTADSDFSTGTINFNAHRPDTEQVYVPTNIHFYYGRVHSPRYRLSGNVGITTHFFEVYCNEDQNCTLADHALYDDTNASTGVSTVRPGPLANQILSVDDIHWYVNEDHNLSAGSPDGNVTNVQERVTPPDEITESDVATNNNQFQFTYDGSKGFPFKSTMQQSTQNYLLFNRFNTNAITNDFELEFNSAGGWAGKNSGNIAVDSNASVNTNRRIEW